MAVVSEVTSMDMQECRRVDAIRRSRWASNGVSAAASFAVVAALVWASLAPPFSDHDLTRMKVSSAPTPRIQGEITLLLCLPGLAERPVAVRCLTYGDDGSENVHEREELDS